MSCNFTYDTYGNSQWGDLLTGYDGRTFSYDAIGNLTSDGERTYTWKHGRQLATLSDSTTTWQYTYNADGMRTKRTTGTDTYTYIYHNGQLLTMSANGTTMHFGYEPDGTPMSIICGQVVYYYITNLQGDVVGLIDRAGTLVVAYTYDAWGNILSCTGSMAATLGKDNPLRYRGYVYDTETGLYYVSSRYYDPEVGRWISPEPNVDYGEFDEGAGLLGYNVYVYCANNPVKFKDDSGEFLVITLSSTAISLIAAAVVTAGTIILFKAHRTLKNGSKAKTNDKHTKPRPGRASEKKKQKDSWKSRK